MMEESKEDGARLFSMTCSEREGDASFKTQNFHLKIRNNFSYCECAQMLIEMLRGVGDYSSGSNQGPTALGPGYLAVAEPS